MNKSTLKIADGDVITSPGQKRYRFQKWHATVVTRTINKGGGYLGYLVVLDIFEIKIFENLRLVTLNMISVKRL